MARSGDTSVTFKTEYFDNIMKSAQIDSLTEATAERAQAIAKSTAPVDSGDYRDRLAVERRQSRFRGVWRVIGRDKKTLLIESKTGNLARALKAAKQ